MRIPHLRLWIARWRDRLIAAPMDEHGHFSDHGWQELVHVTHPELLQGINAILRTDFVMADFRDWQRRHATHIETPHGKFLIPKATQDALQAMTDFDVYRRAFHSYSGLLDPYAIEELRARGLLLFSGDRQPDVLRRIEARQKEREEVAR